MALEGVGGGAGAWAEEDCARWVGVGLVKMLASLVVRVHNSQSSRSPPPRL